MKTLSFKKEKHEQEYIFKLERLREYCIEEGYLYREPLGFTRHCVYCNAERIDIKGIEKEPHKEDCLYAQALSAINEKDEA